MSVRLFSVFISLVRFIDLWVRFLLQCVCVFFFSYPFFSESYSLVLFAKETFINVVLVTKLFFMSTLQIFLFPKFSSFFLSLVFLVQCFHGKWNKKMTFSKNIYSEFTTREILGLLATHYFCVFIFLKFISTQFPCQLVFTVDVSRKILPFFFRPSPSLPPSLSLLRLHRFSAQR